MTNPIRPSMPLLRIGELALRSGLSAKALRLYEQRGLLRPCSHSAAGYRLYGPAAAQRLMQIQLLRRGGFTLAEIARLLQHGDTALGELLAARIDTLQRELADKAQALAALRRTLLHSASSSSPTLDELMEQIAMTQTLKVDFNDAERRQLLERAEALGADGMAQAQQAWPQLIAEVRAAMQAGTSPQHADAQALARRWHVLVQAFTGGDAGIARKLGEAYQHQPQAMAAQGMDPAMFRYIGEAMAAAGLKS